MPTQTLVRYNPSFWRCLLQQNNQPIILSKVKYKKSNSQKSFYYYLSPRECGIATYTQDLIRSISKGFGSSFNISICALSTDHEEHEYSDTIKFILNTDDDESYAQLARDINYDNNISLVVLQHEFGLFDLQGAALTSMLHKLNKPVSIVFHTVLPGPDTEFKNECNHWQQQQNHWSWWPSHLQIFWWKITLLKNQNKCYSSWNTLNKTRRQRKSESKIWTNR